jgi:lipopolysaccharide transport system ATP-binding protein
MTAVVEAIGVGKEYLRSPVPHGTHRTLRDSLASWTASVVRRRKGNGYGVERFWALQDVSFQLHEGEVLGVIGPNGSGKSTLLKIISQITTPTKGEVRVAGTVGSLLEVGTGFHPELTGRENVYLNGAIIGMSQAEVRKKFDEIVAFSGVGPFIDTPVKRYSSGMQVRLAFAVAAHIEPDVLILDEVLAVGDVAFQRKCLDKMKDVGRQGRSVIFVSHSMGSIQDFCDRAIVIKKGRIALDTTDVKKAIAEYVGDGERQKSSVWENSGTQYRNDWFVPRSLMITDDGGKPVLGAIRNTDTAWVRIEGEIVDPDPLLTIGYIIYDERGNHLYWSYPTDSPEAGWTPTRKGTVVMRSAIPRRLLNEGNYRVALLGGIHMRTWLFQPETFVPTVDFTIAGGLSDSPYWVATRPTMLAPVLKWEIEQ